MSRDFEAFVCSVFVADLTGRGYQAQGCHFVCQKGTLRGTVWIVEGVASLNGSFMPRLSIALPALDPTVAVLSRDLHQLVDPNARARWYSWTGESATTIARAKHELLTVGLSWLEKHLDVQDLVHALEQERDRERAPEKRRWWRLRTPSAKDSPPVRLNVLQFLSYAYELQGQPAAALESWERYIAGHSRLEKGSALERAFNERLQALRARSGSSR